MTGKTIIVTTTDRCYLPAACCALHSAHVNLQQKQNVSFFLVCTDVSETDLAKAKSMFAARQMEVNIIDVVEIAEKIEINQSSRWPRSAYLRLYFDEIFDLDIDRLVYLDSDVRVLTDLTPLINLNLHGKPVGAAHDLYYYVTNHISERRQMLFLASDAPYLQSGVMVFDWKTSLDLDIFAKSRQFLKDYHERCVEGPDQDALNAVLENQWVPIDPRWNLHGYYLQYASRHQPFIEHYTGLKPWSNERPPAWKAASQWYRQQLIDTDWSDFVVQPSYVKSIKLYLKFRRKVLIARLNYFLSDYLPSLLKYLGIPVHSKGDTQLKVPRSREHVELMIDAEIEEAALGRLSLCPPESVLGFYSQ